MTRAAEVIVGLDVGTTAVKGAAFGVQGASQPVATALREYPLEQPEPGWQVQDPATVLAAIDAVLAECLDLLGGARVLAVSVSTAMHGLIGLDAQREAVTPLVTWADSRAGAEARELRGQGVALDLLERTGTPVHPMSPLVKLLWFSRRAPELSKRVRWWVGLKDYVLLHLTGELVTELSSASATGLLNVQSRDWDVSAVELAGIEPDQLPPVRPTTTVLALTGSAARRTGLPAGLPVAVGAADGPLGNLGTGAISPGVAGLSLGTSGAVRMAVPAPTFDSAGRLFCYALTDDLWVSGGAISNGGITLRWAGEALAPDLVARGHADNELLALAGRIPPGSDGLLMLPYVLSERAPLWDPDIPGAFLGIRHHHSRGHFLRAAVEGVCLQLAAIVDALDTVSPVTSVRATGGSFRSVLWQQVMAGALGRPLIIQAEAGGTALGAAALGWYALGGAPDLATALAAVGGSDAEPAPPVRVSAEDLAAYAQLRAGVPALITAYDQVARMLSEPPGDRRRPDNPDARR
ncbi:MAG TPA: gluconokinase [Propionibacteriaceae bacterium]|nr:gluconokinase [Propionibacteriaceae bacterium]